MRYSLTLAVRRKIRKVYYNIPTFLRMLECLNYVYTKQHIIYHKDGSMWAKEKVDCLPYYLFCDSSFSLEHRGVIINTFTVS